MTQLSWNPLGATFRRRLLTAAYHAQSLPLGASPAQGPMWSLLWRGLEDLRAGLQRRRHGLNETDMWGLDVDFKELLRPLKQIVAQRYCQLETLGLRHVPAGGQLMIATPASCAAFEGLLLAHTIESGARTSQVVRMLLPPRWFGLPFAAPLLTRLGCLPLGEENVRQLLHRGERVAVFLPEGDQPYRLGQPPHRWLQLAIEAGCPVVPVASVGSREAWPVLYRLDGLAELLGLPGLAITPTFPLLGLAGLLPLPSKWSMSFGASIPTAGLDAGRGADVAELAESLQLRLQDQWNTLAHRRGAR